MEKPSESQRQFLPRRVRRKPVYVIRLPAHIKPALTRSFPLPLPKRLPEEFRFRLNPRALSIDDYVESSIQFEILLASPPTDVATRFEHYMMADEFLRVSLRLAGLTNSTIETLCFSFLSFSLFAPSLSIWRRAYALHNHFLDSSSLTCTSLE